MTSLKPIEVAGRVLLVDENAKLKHGDWSINQGVCVQVNQATCVYFSRKIIAQPIGSDIPGVPYYKTETHPTEFTLTDMVNIVQSIMDYTRESGNVLGYDEREATEFVDIFLNKNYPSKVITGARIILDNFSFSKPKTYVENGKTFIELQLTYKENEK